MAILAFPHWHSQFWRVAHAPQLLTVANLTQFTVIKEELSPEKATGVYGMGWS
jgi:hypothetical protein